MKVCSEGWREGPKGLCTVKEDSVYYDGHSFHDCLHSDFLAFVYLYKRLFVQLFMGLFP